ncbi:HD domain-containing protein [Nanoarchaeota archaeon]
MDFLKFFHNLEGVKKQVREGWNLHKIPQPESIADHSYRVAMMALVLSPQAKLNSEKTMAMALLHDALHALVPDTPSKHDESEQKMTNQEMAEIERKAMKKLLSNLDQKKAKEFFEMFLDVEEKRTKEGEFVKDLDRLEMCFQALEYEKQHQKDLSEFFVYSESRLTHPFVKELFQKLKKSRKSL